MLYERADEDTKKRHGKKLDAFEASSKGDAKKQKEARDKQNQRDLRKRKPVASVDWPWSRVVACEAIDDIRFLIGDEYGRLGLVQVDFRNVQTCLVLIPLGSVCGSHKVAPPLSLMLIFRQAHPQLSPTSAIPRSSLAHIAGTRSSLTSVPS